MAANNKRLRIAFQSAFLVVMVFITLFVYGFMLLFRESLHAGEHAPTAFSAPDSRPVGAPDGYATEVPRGYDVSVSNNVDRRRLTPGQIFNGALAGDPRALSYAYLAVGALGMVLFGIVTFVLYTMISKDDYIMRGPGPRRYGV